MDADDHTATVGSVTLTQAVAILASTTRAGLFSLSGGDDPDMRLAILAVFLTHLCRVEPERAEKMRGVLALVRDEVAPAGA